MPRIAAMNKSDNDLFLGNSAALAVAGLAADVGFVNLDDFIQAAERSGILGRSHGLANAVHHEPCGFVSNPDDAVHLMRRDTFFAGAN